MPISTPRAHLQAFKDLRLDEKFFNQMLACEQEEDGDYDVYLMENGVMPLLMQGLDALSRHVNKLANGESVGMSGGYRQPFNPLVWLAQFMLRNHPGYIRDHRTPMYTQISDLAAAERGRRTLLRQLPQVEAVWKQMAQESGQAGKLDRSQVQEVLQKLDDLWNLDGQFVGKLPDVIGAIIPGDDVEVSFNEFWSAFEAVVKENDVLRSSAFEEAQRRKEQAENEAALAHEESSRRQQALADVMHQRKSLEEQFETLSADVYINGELSQIISKGAVVNAEADEGSLPLQGEHIMLVCLLLRVWGFPVETEEDYNVSPQDEWDYNAVDAFQRWLAEYGPRDAKKAVVDANSLKALMDRDAFQACLMRSQERALKEENDERRLVEVKSVLDTDLDQVYVEALDLQTGDLLQLAIPESQVQEVRRRLQKGGQPVLAKVDPVSQRITDLLPSEGD